MANFSYYSSLYFFQATKSGREDSARVDMGTNLVGVQVNPEGDDRGQDYHRGAHLRQPHQQHGLHRELKQENTQLRMDKLPTGLYTGIHNCLA